MDDQFYALWSLLSGAFNSNFWAALGGPNLGSGGLTGKSAARASAHPSAGSVAKFLELQRPARAYTSPKCRFSWAAGTGW